MEEVQSIYAIGAGTVSKRVHANGQLVRCDTHKDLKLYMDELEEMIKRKRKLFGQKPEEGQIERIERFEILMREAEQLMDAADGGQAEALREKMEALEAYYGSGEWKKDFADDEAGLLPAGLKRGVLSEDGIYDLLERYRERQE